MKHTSLVGGIPVSIERSAKRRTIGLTVERDGTVTARVPSSSSDSEIERVLKSRELWLHSALEKRRETLAIEGGKEFVSGEGFHYLGKSYRLRVLNKSDDLCDATPPLRLFQSRFLLRHDAKQDAAGHFVRWYSEAGRRWLARQLPTLSRRVGVAAAGTRVGDLRYRWASCSENGWLNFHWKTFLLPSGVIRYLVLHELCHLIEHNHSPRFWQLLRAVDQDFQEKERWLAENAKIYTF